jgi:hypothetical protein
LVNQSTTSQIESYPACVQGNPTMKSILIFPISIQGFSRVVLILLVFGALPLLYGRCRRGTRILLCLSSCHTTNIWSSNPSTSWCCQGELNMSNHGLLYVSTPLCASYKEHISVSSTIGYPDLPPKNHWSCYLY